MQQLNYSFSGKLIQHRELLLLHYPDVRISLICLLNCITFWILYVTTKFTVDLGRFFSLLIYTQSVGFLGRGISPSQGRYLHAEQHKHRINGHSPSVLAGQDGSCLRPRGHCDRQIKVKGSYA
jgi:hypothetical protein